MVATATAKTPRTTKAAAAKAEAAAPAPDAPETDSQKRNRLRNEAERHILNLHKDEFDDYAEALFAKNGLTFNRRLSEAQKAEKKIQDLIAKHPELETVLRAQFAAPAPTDDDAPDVEGESLAGHNPEWAPSAGDEVDYSADEAGYVDPFENQR